MRPGRARGCVTRSAGGGGEPTARPQRVGSGAPATTSTAATWPPAGFVFGADWFFLAPSGALVGSWLKDGGCWYYLDPASGTMRRPDRGGWHVVLPSGAMHAPGGCTWTTGGTTSRQRLPDRRLAARRRGEVNYLDPNSGRIFLRGSPAWMARVATWGRRVRCAPAGSTSSTRWHFFASNGAQTGRLAARRGEVVLP